MIKQKIQTDPPNIDQICYNRQLGRHELILLAKEVAREHKCSASEALRRIGDGKENIADLNEKLIVSLQERIPITKEDEDKVTES